MHGQYLAGGDSLWIDTVRVFGNVRTRTEIILRELEFGPGDCVTPASLRRAENHLRNLKLFTHVDFRVIRKPNRHADLEIRVWERMSRMPVPVLFMNERDWKKWSYGLGYYDTNLHGRGETLWLAGWLGYNPGFEISYNNRWFGGRHRLYSRANLMFQTVQSKMPEYRKVGEKHRKASFTLGKRRGYEWYADVTVTFDRIGIPVKELRWESTRRWENTLSGAVQLKKDSRDLWDFPRSGGLWTFEVSRTELLGSPLFFDRFKLDLREYLPVGREILAFRLMAAHSRGTVPSYQRLYFGYDERLRGHFNEVFSGDGQAFAGAEWRIPLLRDRPLQMPVPPDYKIYFQRMKYSLYLTLFLESGSVWEQDEAPLRTHWYSGSGIGLNVVLPYSAVLRIEYAWNERGRGELIIDAMTAF